MIVRKLSEEEFELVKNRGSKTVVQVLGLHNEIASGMQRAGKVPEVQKTISEAIHHE